MGLGVNLLLNLCFTFVLNSGSKQPSSDKLHQCTGLSASLLLSYVIRSRGYKTFFMLNSTEHKISTAHKN